MVHVLFMNCVKMFMCLQLLKHNEVQCKQLIVIMVTVINRLYRLYSHDALPRGNPSALGCLLEAGALCTLKT